MRKKINKLIKNILVISLCFSIFPCYANNISVSDGSAFITKSELSYSLNNLSNRMRELEISLENRINDLVSSYLTRNGIWNSNGQTILNNTIIDCSGYDVTGSNANVVYSTQFASSLSAGDSVVFKNYSENIVDKINKDGLCLLLVRLTEIGQSIASDGRSFTCWRNPIDTRFNSWNLFNVDDCYVTILKNDTEVARFKQYSLSFEQIENDRLIMMRVVPATLNLYFFVSKGDTLSFNYNVGLRIMSTGCGLYLQGKNSEVGGSPSSLKCIFEKCEVY